MTVKTIDVDGFCWQIDDSGSGTAVVMCHGFPGLGYSYRHQSAALAEAGFRSIALDMPGYGGTTRPDAVEDYTNDAVANRLDRKSVGSGKSVSGRIDPGRRGVIKKKQTK